MTTYPLQLISGLTNGISYSSQALIGDIMPSCSTGLAGLRYYYNVQTKNITLVETAASLALSSGTESIGYVFNSNASDPWQYTISRFSTLPSSSAADGAKATLITEDGAEVQFQKSGGVYLEADFGVGRCRLEYCADNQGYWILYDPSSQIRHVYDTKGRQIAKYRDGATKTTYEYDDQNRLTTINIPGQDNRCYTIAYTSNSDGTETQRISLSVDIKGQSTTLPIREYQFSSDRLITQITVFPQNSDPSLNASDANYTVKLGYRKRYDQTWGLISLSEDDGSVQGFQYDQKSCALYQVNVGYNKPYAIYLADNSDHTVTTVRVQSAMQIDIACDAATGLVKSISRYTGYQTPETPDVTTYGYENSRLTSKQLPDGSVVGWTLDATEGLGRGLVLSKSLGGQDTQYSYEIINNRIYRSSITTIRAEGGNPQVEHFLHRVYGKRQTYQADYCIVLAYRVSPAGRVTAYQPDSSNGLVSLTQQFSRASYSDDLTVDKLDEWVLGQYKNKAYTYVEKGYYPGTTLIAASQAFGHVDNEGNGVLDNQHSLLSNAFDPYLRVVKITTTLSYSKDKSGFWVANGAIQYKSYTTFGHLVNSHYEEQQFDLVTLLQTKAVGEALTVDVELDSEYQYDASSATSPVTKVTTQPNGREDTQCYNEHGWLVSSKQADTAAQITRTTQNTYDTVGRLAQVLDATGKKTWKAFDKQDRLAFEVDAVGNVTQYFYNAPKRYQQRVRYNTPIDVSQLSTVVSGSIFQSLIKTDPDNDRVTTHCYDQRGNETYTIHPDGYVQENRFCLRNNHVATILYKTPITDEQRSDLLAGKVPDLGGPDNSTVIGPDTAALYDITNYYYDVDDLLYLTIDADGWCIAIINDDAGNPIVKRYSTENYVGTRPLIDTPAYPKGDDDIYQLRYYDAQKRLIMSVDSEGYVTCTDYDANSRVVKTTRYVNTLDISTLLADESHAIPDAPDSDDEDLITNNSYDTKGRLIHSERSDQLSTCTVYDNMGQTLSSVQYDQTQLTAIDSGDAFRSNHFQYSLFGEVTAKSNAWIASEVLGILADASLTPDQREEKLSDFWSQSAVRRLFSESGLLLKTCNTLHVSTDNNEGATIRFYDANNRVLFTVDSEGGITQLSYNAFNQVSQTRQYVTAMDPSSSDYQNLSGGTITDAAHTLITALQSASDPIRKTEYNTIGQAAVLTDGAGYQTQKTYDFKGRLLKTEQSKASASAFDLITTNTYDGRDNITKTVSASSDAALSTTQSWAFDHVLNVLTSSSNGTGLITYRGISKRGLVAFTYDNGSAGSTDKVSFSYDFRSRVLTRANALGDTITHTYVQATRTHTSLGADKITTVSIVSNVFGAQVSLSKGVDSTLKWTHDGAGNVLVQTDAVGSTSSTERNTDGVVTQKTDPVGRITTYTPDNRGLVVEREEDTKGRQLITTYKHDGLGRVTQSTNPRDVVTTQEYDMASNNTVTTVDPGTDAAPGLKRATTRTFDGLQHCLTSTVSGSADSATYKEKYVFDGLGRSTGTTIDPDALALATSNTLNADGKAILSVDPEGGKHYSILNEYGLVRFSVNPDGLCTEYQYDGLHRQSVQYTYAGKIPSDVLTQLSAATTASEASTLLSPYRGSATYAAYAHEQRSFYDANGRVIYSVTVHRNDPDNSASGEASIVETSYDAAGRPIKRTAYSQLYTWTEEPTWDNASLEDTIESISDPSNDRSTYFVVDGAGRVRYTVSSIGQVTETCYRADSTVWLTVQYSTLLSDLSDLDGISLDAMATKIAGIKNTASDIQKGSFTNNHGKIIYQFQSYSDANVSLKRYEYDGADNLITQTEFAGSIDLSSRDAGTVLAAFDAVVDDPTVDSVSHQTFDNTNLLTAATDPLGYTESYARNGVGLMISHTDRSNHTWGFEYDGAKRCVKKTSPQVSVSTVTQDKDASGNITLTNSAATRSVINTMTYDGLNNVIESVKDQGHGNYTAKATFDAQSNPVEVYQEDVAVDDGSTVNPSLATLPTESMTVKQATYRNGFGLVSLTSKNGLPYEATIYGRNQAKQFYLKFTSSDSTAIAVTEYRYNAFGDLVLTISYANPLTVSGDWDDSWFISTAIRFLSQVGSVTASTADRVVYNKLNKAGVPEATYTGIDLEKSDLDAETFVGLVPYLGADTQSKGMGYALVEREYFQGKCVAVSRLIDPDDDADKKWDRTLYWYDQAGNVAAKAVLTALNYTVDSTSGLESKTLAMIVVRYQYNQKGLKTSERAYSSTSMSYDELHAVIDDLSALDEVLALYESDSDRTTERNFDLRGSLILETQKNVTRHEVTATKDAAGVTTYSLTKLSGDLSKETAYGPTALIIKESSRYFSRLDPSGESGASKQADTPDYKYNGYDARGVLLYTVDFPVGDSALLPFTKYGIDARQNAVTMQSFEQGADPDTVGKSQVPSPLSEDPDKDPVHVMSFDKRGLVDVDQDPLGNPTLNTYDKQGKNACQYGPISLWRLSSSNEYTQNVSVDAKRTEYSIAGNKLSEAVYRDGTSQNQDLSLSYDLLGQNTGEGASSDSLVLYKIYDVLGNIRLTNAMKGKRGVSVACQFNLSSRKTEDLESAGTDLSTMTIDDLEDSIYNVKDLAITRYYPAQGTGNILKMKLPTSDVTVSNLEPVYLPIQMATQVFAEEFGVTGATLEPLLLWAKSTVSNAEPELTFDGAALDITNIETSWKADVSKHATGTYNYSIQYMTTDPIDGTKTEAYRTEGSVSIVTSLAPSKTDKSVIPFVRDDSTLCFAGNVSDFSSVKLYDSSGSLASTVSLTDGPSNIKLADLSAMASAAYTPSLLDSSGTEHKLTTSFAINTLSSPTDNQSWEIPCSSSLSISGTTGTLSLWDSLPPSLQSLSVSFDCSYTDTDGNAQTLSKTVSPTDSKASITFDHAVQSVESVSIGLVLDANNTLALYQDATPDSGEDLSYTLPDKRYAYLRGKDFSGQTGDVTVKYYDVSQDQEAKWALITGSATSDGLLFDVTYFDNGNYPVIKEDGDIANPIGSFGIDRGGIVTASVNSPQTPRLSDDTQAIRYCDYDAFGNQIAYQDACGNRTTFTYDSDNKEITRMNPAIDTYANGNYEKTTPVQGVVSSYYDRIGNHIAHGYPMGGQKIYVKDLAGNIITEVSAENQIRLQNTLNALSQVTSYLRFGQKTQHDYDLAGNLVTQTFPATNAQGTSLQITQQFDEHSQLIAKTDGGGFTVRYNYTTDWLNDKSKVKAFFDATNHQYDYEWLRDLKISETRPDGLSQSWGFQDGDKKALFQYIGLSDQQTDLGGVITQKSFDFSLGKIKQITTNISNETRGQFVTMTPYSTLGNTSDAASSTYQFKKVDQPDQNIVFTRSVGLLTQIEDKSTGLTVEYQYDHEQRKLTDTMRRSDDQSVIHQSVASYDALGQKDSVYDSDLFMGFVFDLNGDVIRVTSNQLKYTEQNYYNTYNKARQAVMVQASLDTDGTIKLLDQGMEMGYNEYGQRISETSHDGSVQSITYSWDNRITGISKTTAGKEPTVWHTYHNMHTLIDQLINANRTMRFPAVSLPQFRLKGISNALQYQLGQEAKALARSEEHYTWILPVDLGGLRWAIVLFAFTDADLTKPRITYLDPYGDHMPRKLYAEIARVFRHASVAISGHRYQRSVYYSGAWCIDMLESVLKTGTLPSRVKSIKQIKRSQLLRLMPQFKDAILRERSSSTSTWSFTYDDSRFLAEQTTVSGSKTTVTTSSYDGNGSMLSQVTKENGSTTNSTNYTLLACGEIDTQSTTQGKNSWLINYTYLPMSSLKVQSTEATTTDIYGHKLSYCDATYNPNGDLWTKMGASDDTGNKNKGFRAFFRSPTGTNHGGLDFSISAKTTSSWTDFNKQASALSRVALAPDNTFIGYYNLSGSNAVVAAMKLHNINANGTPESLRADIAEMMLSPKTTAELKAEYDAQADAYADTNYKKYEYHINIFGEDTSDIMGAKNNAKRAYKKKNIYLPSYLSKSIDPNYVHSILDSQSGHGSSYSMVATATDTFETLSEAYYGDTDAEEAFELANGYPVIDPDSTSDSKAIANLYRSPKAGSLPEGFLMKLSDLLSSSGTLPGGLRVSVPSYVSNYNTSDTYTPLAQIESLEVGTLIAHLNFAKKKKHWYSVLTRIVIAVAVIVVSVMAPNPFLAAIFAAATDASLQAEAKLFGLIDNFDIGEVISSAISGAFSGSTTFGNVLKEGASFADIAKLVEAVGVVVFENAVTQLVELATGVRKSFSWREMADAAALYVVNAGINTGLKSAGITNSSSLQDRLIRDAVEGEADALVQSAVMGTKFDPFSQVGVMAGSDIAFEYGHVGEVKHTLSTMMNSSDNTAKTQSTEIQSLTGVYLPVPAGVTDPGQTQMTSNGHIAQAAPATPEDSAQFASKAKALGLSTDISESQWIQSAMGYNRDTTAFNYTQNATSMPSMQLDYSRFMDSVMTATQPTQKYPAYAASNPSSVQSTAQGVGGDKGTVLGNLKLGLESFADAAFKLSPSDDVKAWRQSNRAERNKLINTYHDWQAKMRANFPKTYQVSNAIAQGAAPAAEVSKLALITIAGASLAIESGGVLTGVALDMMYAAAEESIGAFAVGESASISGATVARAATGAGALDLSLRDLAGSAKPGVSSTTGSVSKVGVFARSGRSELASSMNLTPEEELAEAISSPEVTRQLDSISVNSPNAREALNLKLRALSDAQSSAEKVIELSNGKVRFYDKFRPARNPGPTSGARFVTEFFPETGELVQWNENYDNLGSINRVRVKNINGIQINSPHFPPTAKELLSAAQQVDSYTLGGGL